MKVDRSLSRSSRPSHSWIAGIFLIAACILFIISHVYIRWSTFPFEYRDIGSVYSGLWRRNVLFSGRLITFKIDCAKERKPCMKLILARIFMVMTCITSGMGGICLCIVSTAKAKYKSISYSAGLSLAVLSFVFSMIGCLLGISWFLQFENDAMGGAAICALGGSFLALVSAVCAFFIHSNQST